MLEAASLRDGSETSRIVGNGFPRATGIPSGPAGVLHPVGFSPSGEPPVAGERA